MRIAKTAFLLFLALPGVTLAQGYGYGYGGGGRAQAWDFSLGAIYQGGEKASGTGGSSLDMSGEIGFAFNIGYNFTNRLALSADFNFCGPVTPRSSPTKTIPATRNASTTSCRSSTAASKAHTISSTGRSRRLSSLASAGPGSIRTWPTARR